MICLELQLHCGVLKYKIKFCITVVTLSSLLESPRFNRGVCFRKWHEFVAFNDSHVKKLKEK